MENKNTSNRIHPLVAGAAVSVMVVSLAGVAAITGLLPNSHSGNSPVATDTPAATSSTTATTSATPVAGSIGAAATAASPAALIEPKTPAVTAAVTEPKSVATDAPSAPAPKHHSQATRTAKATHAQTRPAPNYAASEPVTVAQAPICSNCGRVEAVQAVQQQAKPSGLGVAAGAVLGGILGNQVGNGNGRTLATVAGAVGGGYAGNEVEKRTHSTTTYQVRVRMEDGQVRSFPYSQAPAWSAGDRVKVVNGQLASAG
jgi:outer membrane lipoprotein SlyB